MSPCTEAGFPTAERRPARRGAGLRFGSAPAWAVGALALSLAGCATRGLQPLGPALDPEPRDGAFSFAVLGELQPGRPAVPGDPASPCIDYLEQINWINFARPDFTVHLGNLIRGPNHANPELTEAQWREFERAAALHRQPVFLAPGNRDVWDAASAQLFRRRYGPPTYSFDHRGCHFTVLSAEFPETGLALEPMQRAWLLQDLMAARDARQRFVFLHAPLWLSRYGAAGANAWMRDVHPLLKAYRVDTVFAAGEPCYVPDEVEGIRYLITGGGGAELGGRPELGDFFHFLLVTVHEGARPTVSVMRRGQALPEDCVPRGLRRAADAAAAEVAVHWFTEPVLARDPEPRVVRVPVANLLESPVTADLTWRPRSGAGLAPGVSPPVVTLALAPGETRTTEFSIAAAPRPLALEWSVRRGGAVVYEGRLDAPFAKPGLYSVPPQPEVRLTASGPDDLIWGGRQWDGPADLAAAAWVIRLTNGLSVSVEVADDVVRVSRDVPPRENDGVELFFDLRADGRRTAGPYERGVFKLDVLPASGDGVEPVAVDCAGPADGEVPGATATSRRLPGHGYLIEVFLPFEGLAATQLVPGVQFHFSYGVNDRDQARCETRLLWSGTDRNPEDPIAFGRLSPRGEEP